MYEYVAGLRVSGRTITFAVRNNGTVPGSEVPQLYLRFPASAGEPPKQLKDYTKILLAPGATATVVFELNDRSFSIWNVLSAGPHGWEVKMPYWSCHC